MKIEVFIPYFNHEKYILQTIASVDNCSNRNLDIVIKIVNDGSNYKNLINHNRSHNNLKNNCCLL
jgi:glycosyltransferase involved in cell wall biosynthesis